MMNMLKTVNMNKMMNDEIYENCEHGEYAEFGDMMQNVEYGEHCKTCENGKMFKVGELLYYSLFNCR